MFQRLVVVNVAVVLAVALIVCDWVQGQDLKTVTACYGINNNYLRLECEPGYYIHVLAVIHASKLKTADCVAPFTVDTYRRECCGITITDCNINVQDGAIIQCEDRNRCVATATWSNTNKECDQDIYPATTNYMRMDYHCMKRISSNGTTTENIPPSTSPPLTSLNTSLPPVSSTTTPTTTPITTTTTTPTTTPITTTTTPTTLSSTTTFKQVVYENATFSVTIPVKTAAAHSGNDRKTQEENEELSDAMIGAIVGGCLGMLFTFIVFVFYWGRKRRLRIVGKPQASVWDYLLSQTFTVRGSKGYDHFSSIRSSASSDGDPNSPVVRKNIWLPNIVDKDYKSHEDVISNYDNDSDRCHRVEIHHNASPSPYAILNLHANNVYQDTNHEA